MLAAMTYEVGLLLAVVFGLGLGRILTTRLALRAQPTDQKQMAALNTNSDPCCEH